jgi:hypothetical protein
MSHTKKWVLFSLLSILLTLFFIAGVNFFMDPLWTFEHEHQFNQYQRASKERQQKSNALYFRTQKYNSLILGSSRTTYMDQDKWDANTYNYAVSDMQPNEYGAYLDFAINKAKQPVKRVIIGLDFFGALTYAPMVSKQPDLILDEINKPFYRYKLLLSIDSLDYSFKNIKSSFTKPYGKYTYNNIKASFPNNNLSKIDYLKRIQGNLETYARDRYSHPYDGNYQNEISEFVEAYPDIEFIVFTTPVSSEHLDLLISKNLYKDYERWLKESVKVFGKINHFMYKNELTKSANIYFKDSNHAFNSTNECLTKEMLEQDSNCSKINMILTRENLDTKLSTLRELNLYEGK